MNATHEEFKDPTTKPQTRLVVRIGTEMTEVVNGAMLVSHFTPGDPNADDVQETVPQAVAIIMGTGSEVRNMLYVLLAAADEAGFAQDVMQQLMHRRARIALGLPPE